MIFSDKVLNKAMFSVPLWLIMISCQKGGEESTVASSQANKFNVSNDIEVINKELLTEKCADNEIILNCFFKADKTYDIAKPDDFISICKDKTDINRLNIMDKSKMITSLSAILPKQVIGSPNSQAQTEMGDVNAKIEGDNFALGLLNVQSIKLKTNSNDSSLFYIVSNKTNSVTINEISQKNSALGHFKEQWKTNSLNLNKFSSLKSYSCNAEHPNHINKIPIFANGGKTLINMDDIQSVQKKIDSYMVETKNADGKYLPNWKGVLQNRMLLLYEQNKVIKKMSDDFLKDKKNVNYTSQEYIDFIADLKKIKLNKDSLAMEAYNFIQQFVENCKEAESTSKDKVCKTSDFVYQDAIQILQYMSMQILVHPEVKANEQDGIKDFIIKLQKADGTARSDVNQNGKIDDTEDEVKKLDFDGDGIAESYIPQFSNTSMNSTFYLPKDVNTYVAVFDKLVAKLKEPNKSFPMAYKELFTAGFIAAHCESTLPCGGNKVEEETADIVNKYQFISQDKKKYIFAMYLMSQPSIILRLKK